MSSAADSFWARPVVVCVQGLGFVGTAMSVAIARTFFLKGNSTARVVGVDVDTQQGRERVLKINQGVLPFASSDSDMHACLSEVVEAGILTATTDVEVFSQAAVTVVDVNLDIDLTTQPATVDFTGFDAAIRTLGSRMPDGSLLIVETTVPPGTTEHRVVPIVQEELAKRGLPKDAISTAHSYERVMPGLNYLASIVNYWRAYAGSSRTAADKCEEFLSGLINVGDYPLKRLPNTTASELAKVVENAYRAANIAFADEWGAFAEHIGVDLFKVIDAIRVRPTHSNLMEPGLGVGGYCLTKDPLFAEVAAHSLFQDFKGNFPISRASVEINAKMPTRTFDAIKHICGGELDSKRVLILGASYRPDVGDARSSPSAKLTNMLLADQATVRVWDPLVTTWEIPSVPIEPTLPKSFDFDVIVFAVGHTDLKQLDVQDWLRGTSPLLIDANHVLSEHQRNLLLDGTELRLFSIGRGYA